MKDKLLLPVIIRDQQIYSRQNLNGESVACAYRTSKKWFHTETLNHFRTQEEAISDMDTYLIETGYTLLTQDQYDKLKPLL